MDDNSPFDGIEVEDMEQYVEEDNSKGLVTGASYRFEHPPMSESIGYEHTMNLRGLAAAKESKQTEEPPPPPPASPPAPPPSHSHSSSSYKDPDLEKKPQTSSIKIKAGKDDQWVRRSSRQTNANPKYAESGDLSFLEEEDADDETDNTEDDMVAKPQRRRRAGRRNKYVIVRKIETLLGKKTNKDTGEQMYLVKWNDTAYIHCSWETEITILTFHNGTHHLARFAKKAAYGKVYIDINDDYFNPDYTQIDRIIATRSVMLPRSYAFGKTVSGEGDEGEVEIVQFLVKWCALQYADSTWETHHFLEKQGYGDEIDRFFKIARLPKTAAGLNNVSRARRPRKFVERKESPSDFEPGHELRSYQLEGMNWLCFNWHKGRNSILADEMGLGKTVQSVALFHYLYKQQNIPGPFLVVAPLSTIAHWKREVQGWTQMHPVVYHGSSSSREIIRKHEWNRFLLSNCTRDKETGKILGDLQDVRTCAGRYRFNILVTTYEMILRDSERLSGIPWACIVVDEAHRLKNRHSSLFRALSSFTLHHIVLLTGTPIQNKIAELGTLLHFLEPTTFTDINAFELQFGNLQKKNQVDALHTLLRPYLLRRMKGDVEKALPPREETLVEVQLTRAQKQYYKAIYEKNTEYLVSKTGSKPSLINIGMQLRKCCNHPFLLDGAEDAILSEELPGSTENEDKDGKQQEKMERSYDSDCKKMILSCGKLVLVDKLLPKLKSQGHRVLIFSQMVRVLDILEDYLRFRSYSYERLDGTMKSADRQAGIDRFSKEGSDIFVFLLCTRAGGVGINLTAADTVIIYDSDWNPQNDIQAQARCHRIGQTKNVKVYRLVTANTYESEMFHRASMKLGLDKAVLHSMGETVGSGKKGSTGSMKKSEVEALLKHGAYHVFLNTDESKADEFCEQDIDAILARNSRVVTMGGEEGEAGSLAGNSTFSKATFVAEDEKVDINDPNFWTKLGLKKQAPASQYLGTRRRTLTKRFGMAADDEDFAGSDSGGAHAGDGEFVLTTGGGAPIAADDPEPEDPRFFENYTQKERDEFVTAVTTFGPFRWNEARGRGVRSQTSNADGAARIKSSLTGRTDKELTKYFLGFILLHLRLIASSAIPSIQHSILNQVLHEARRLLPPGALEPAVPTPSPSPPPKQGKAENDSDDTASEPGGSGTQPKSSPEASPSHPSVKKEEDAEDDQTSSASGTHPVSGLAAAGLATVGLAAGLVAGLNTGSDPKAPKVKEGNDNIASPSTPAQSVGRNKDGSVKRPRGRPRKDASTKAPGTGRKIATQTQREAERVLQLVGGCDSSLESPVFVTRCAKRARASLLVVERLWILHQIMLTPLFVPGAREIVRDAKKNKRKRRESGAADGDASDEKNNGGKRFSRWCRIGYWQQFQFPPGFKLKEAKAGPPAEWWGVEDDQELIKGVYLLGLGEKGYRMMREHPDLKFRRHQAEAPKKSTKGRQRSYDADGNKLWPSVSTLNKRFIMLISALAKDLRKAQKDEKQKRKKKVKQVKSAWMFFSKQVWNSVKAENPESNFSEIGKKVGEKWKLLTPEEKLPYADMHKEDLVRYRAARREADEQELAEDTWDSNQDSDHTTVTKKPTKIKSAKSAWMFFNKEKWAETQSDSPGAGFTDVCKMLAKKWRELSKAEKQPYMKLQNKDHERYNKQMAARGHTSSKKKKNKVKVAKSAWMFFNKEKWAEAKADNPEANFAEIGKIVGRQWKALTEEEKLPYQEQYKTDLVRYRKELKAAKELKKREEDEESDKTTSTKQDTPAPTSKSSNDKRRHRPRPVKSAWVYFSKQEWAKVKADNPDMDFATVGRAVSERWKALSVEEKEPFFKSQKADAARYKREKAAAVEGTLKRDGDADQEEKVSKGKIKQVKSAWIYFSKDTWPKVKAENPDASFQQIGRKVGELWKSLTQEEKRPYIMKQQADAERYRAEKDRQMAAEAKTISKTDPTAAAEAVITRKKVMPPRPSYMFYARKHWNNVIAEVKAECQSEEAAAEEKKADEDADATDDDNETLNTSAAEVDTNSSKSQKPKFSFALVSKSMGARWKVLGVDVKQTYFNLAKEDRERFKRESEAAEKEYNEEIAKYEAKIRTEEGDARTATPVDQEEDAEATSTDDDGEVESASKPVLEKVSLNRVVSTSSQLSTATVRGEFLRKRKREKVDEMVNKKPKLGLRKADVKKAKSAWMYFSMAMWDTVRADMPDALFGDIGKYLGECWKTLVDDEKAPYIQKHLKDKERFSTEILNCVEEKQREQLQEKTQVVQQSVAGDSIESNIQPAKTAFHFYASENRTSLEEKFPDDTPTQISKRLSEKWRAISPESKSKYLSKHEDDINRYEAEMKNVNTNDDEEISQMSGGPSSSPGPHVVLTATGKPKGVKTAWQCYSKANWAKVAAENPDKKFAELGKIVGQRWKSLTMDEKKPYEEMSLLSHKAAASGASIQRGRKRKAANPPAQKEEKKIKRDKDGNPKAKNARSAWMFFSKSKWAEIQATHPSSDFSTIGRIVGNQWKALTEEDKKPYVKLHEKDVERYRKEREALGLPVNEPDTKTSRTRKGKETRVRPATTAFVFFSRELRPTIKLENPNMPADQIRRTLSEAWRTIDPESKEKYLKKHQGDLERFKREKAEFDAKVAANNPAAVAKPISSPLGRVQGVGHQSPQAPAHPAPRPPSASSPSPSEVPIGTPVAFTGSEEGQSKGGHYGEEYMNPRDSPVPSEPQQSPIRSDGYGFEGVLGELAETLSASPDPHQRSNVSQEGIPTSVINPSPFAGASASRPGNFPMSEMGYGADRALPATVLQDTSGMKTESTTSSMRAVPASVLGGYRVNTGALNPARYMFSPQWHNSRNISTDPSRWGGNSQPSRMRTSPSIGHNGIYYGEQSYMPGMQFDQSTQRRLPSTVGQTWGFNPNLRHNQFGLNPRIPPGEFGGFPQRGPQE
ncbi:hypothetical protein AAMO2058_001122500 [Amorphochlora amoebiformis]